MALILVVDDDDAMRQLVRHILEPHGHTIIEAANGRLALERLRQHQQVELVITDMIMPEQEGIETILQIRRHYAGVPIVAISGSDKAGSIYLGAAAKLGADAVLSKPFRAPVLLETVTDLLAGEPKRSKFESTDQQIDKTAD